MYDKILHASKDYRIIGNISSPKLASRLSIDLVTIDEDDYSLLKAIDGISTVNEILLRINFENKKEESIQRIEKLLKTEAISLSDLTSPYSMPDRTISDNKFWLKEVIWDVTSKCNLRCKHCFMGDEVIERETVLSFNEAMELLEKFEKIGVHRVGFTGGEPFFRKDLKQIIGKIYEHKMLFAVVNTNGTIHNKNSEEIVNFIIEHDIPMWFFVGIEGCTEAVNDKIRGKGAFDKTTEFIKHLVDLKKKNNSKFSVEMNTIINKYNYNDLIAWYELAKKLGVERARVNYGFSFGNYEKNINMFDVSTEELFPKFKELIEYAIDDIKNANFNLENLPVLAIDSMFMSEWLLGNREIVFGDVENKPICEYFHNSCCIGADGTLKHCVMSEHVYKYDNVMDNDFEVLLNETEFSKNKNTLITEIEECKGCEYIKKCRGGCRVVAGNFKQTKPIYFCESTKFFYNEILPILEQNGAKVIYSDQGKLYGIDRELHKTSS